VYGGAVGAGVSVDDGWGLQDVYIPTVEKEMTADKRED